MLSQDSEEYLGIKPSWDVLKHNIAPIDHDFVLRTIGRDLIERNTDLYHEATLYAEILCGMVDNIVAASSPLNSSLHTKHLYMYSRSSEELGAQVVDLIRKVGEEKKSVTLRSKSKAHRFGGVIEACQKQEKFKSSKAVQRILSSKAAKFNSGQDERKRVTYMNPALLTRVDADMDTDAAPEKRHRDSTGAARTAAVESSKVVCSDGQLAERSDALSALKDAHSDAHNNEGEDDFYSTALLDSGRAPTPAPTIDSGATAEANCAPSPSSSESDSTVIKPQLYDEKAFNAVTLCSADFTPAFVEKIRVILDEEYKDLLVRIDKMRDIITNVAKINELALSILEDLWQLANQATEADVSTLKSVIESNMYDKAGDATAKTTKAPLLQEGRQGMALKSPISCAAPSASAISSSMIGNMSTLKQLPKIANTEAKHLLE